MVSRLEIKGFKTLVDVSIDLGRSECFHRCEREREEQFIGGCRFYFGYSVGEPRTGAFTLSGRPTREPYVLPFRTPRRGV